MLQHTHALINSAILFILLATLGFAQKDSTEDIIAAEYCLQDSTWNFLLMEQFAPLTIQVQKECFGAGYSISLLELKDLNIWGGITGTSSGCMGKVKGEWREVPCNVAENITILDKLTIGILNHEKFSKDLDKNVSKLTEKPFPIKWEFDIHCGTGNDVYKLSGEHNIKVTGICTEEQLKKIDQNLQDLQNKEKEKEKEKN